MIDRRTVITRKAHVCWGCDRLMPAGLRMFCGTEFGDGPPYRTYWCTVCLGTLEALVRDGHIDQGDEWGRGEVRGEYPEQWRLEAARPAAEVFA